MSWNAVVFRPHFLTRLASLCSKGALEVDADAAGPCELACERVRRHLQSSFFKMLLCMIDSLIQTGTRISCLVYILFCVPLSQWRFRRSHHYKCFLLLCGQGSLCVLKGRSCFPIEERFRLRALVVCLFILVSPEPLPP